MEVTEFNFKSSNPMTSEVIGPRRPVHTRCLMHIC